MNYLSVCSGIEAATCAWHPLGWNPVAFSEIEKFPSQVLAHHYPSVPNLGDMTKFEEWPDATIDLLVGGTPCQSFSVAGLRKGLADPRGNLMLTYGAIARRYRPKWLVWENVPGVLSSNGGDDFKSFLDMLESLGYVCDVEILDAQFFGVPQRRRRVFVCAQHRDDLLSQKTDTSALTITQCLQEILLCILSEARSRFGSEQGSSDLPSRSKDGAKRRMELFGLAGEADCWPMLLENLAEAFRRLPQEQRPLGATHGEPGKEPTPGVQSTDSQTESLFTLTEQSLKNALDDALEVMRLFITSTATSSITQAQIFSCSRAALLIAKLTQRLSQSSPAFWNSALSSLTAVEEFTDYARSTSSDLFGDMERLQSWCYFIEQAEHSNDTFISFGVECFGEIFPLPDCLQGHPAPSREAGEGAAGGAGAGAESSSPAVGVCPTLRAGGNQTGGDRPPGTDVDTVDSLVITMAHGQGGAEIGFDRGPTLTCNHEAPIAAYATCVTGQVTHTLKAEGFDASEDGTGRGQPIVAFSCKDHGGDAGQISPTMRSMGHDGSHANAGGQVAVAVSLRGREGGATAELGDEVGNCLRASGGGVDKAHVLAPVAVQASQSGVRFNDTVGTLDANYGSRRHNGVMTAMQVRRLTPVECERLQGFPDDYTLIPVGKKMAADGPRYKALGNSMAVPCMAWIGKRIQLVEQIKEKNEVAA